MHRTPVIFVRSITTPIPPRWFTPLVSATGICLLLAGCMADPEADDPELVHAAHDLTTAANVAPSVTITSPRPGATYTAPATITISASASDADGAVTKVEFFKGTTKIGEDAVSPYGMTWNAVPPGLHTLTARATDDGGATATSGFVQVTVDESLDACQGVPAYVENGGYVAGSVVKNVGHRFKCKPWPNSAWCNGVAWAYAPGVGAYWSDAWTASGGCAK